MNDHRSGPSAPTTRGAPSTPEEEKMHEESDRAAVDEETQPRQRGDDEPEPRTDDRAEQRGDDEPEPRTDDRAEQRADDEAEPRTDDRAEQRADDEAEPQTDDRREQGSDDQPKQRTDDRPKQRSEDDSLLQELVSYLRESRTELREEWARRISEAELLGVMSDEEIFSEATEVYDNYVDALETGSIENLQTYARELSERIIPRGVETHEVLGIVLLLRDVLARALFAKYEGDLQLLDRILDSYEPAANRIAVTVGVSFVEERERVINEQQEAMRELSTPVLQLRDRLLILPIIGVLDSARARQLTEQLLSAIRDNRATVVVIDITGVATIDRTVANHLVQTVEASRLMGARTILTGLSSEIAQTLVDLDVDLGMMETVGDLQGGIEEAERLAGYRAGEVSDADGDASN
jgi:rsbT co-antagonist protein RsbR